MKRISTNTFTTIATQGGMFPPEFLQRICDLDKTVQGLSAVDYHLPEHRRISEKANSAWSELLTDWKAFKFKADGLEKEDPSTGITRDQWLLPLFEQLGYGRLKKAGSTVIDGKDYPVSHFWEQSPIHLVGWNLDLDTRSSGVAGAARFAPHGMLQEFLNRSDDHLWGFVSNGRKLRILRDNVSMTRQAYVEFDLEAMMEGECYSDFVLLWLLCHHSRVEVPLDEEGKPRTPEACWLERWSREAETQGARLLDHLRQGVEQAIQSFGSGFLAHPANQALRERLRAGELDKQDYYRQLLRLVYRLIFLFVAEDRDLLHESGADTRKKQLYFDHYSTQRIRRIAEAKRGSRHRDLWESFKLLFSWLSDPKGCDRLGLSPLGGFLFSEDAMPDLATAKVANVDLLNAVRCLAVTDGDGARRPVDYRNLGAEELGSIYESLLEMHPDLHLEAATFELDVAAGNERKSTGSYYTPKQLVNCLLDSALDPVVEARLKEAARTARTAGVPPASVSQAARLPSTVQEAQEEALLSLKVCDPACGSGHFLIGAAHRIAKHLASVRSGDAEPSPEATHHALRDVITHCIYGVDINPMSVELCKVSLWMEAMEPGKPLGFLDHHIKCGNSLLGTTPALLSRGIPDAAFNPIEGDNKAVCTLLKKQNKDERDKGQGDLFAHAEAEWSYQHAFEKAILEIDHLPDADLSAVERKRLAYETFLQSTSYTGGKRLHDAWCAAFVQLKAEGVTNPNNPSANNQQPFITQQLIREMQTDPNRCPKAQRELIDQLAKQYQFFHWHIEFPEVFQPLESFMEKDYKGWNGGFDCMLGNPPWDRIKPEPTKYFAATHPEISNAKNASARGKLMDNLRITEPKVYESWRTHERQILGIGASITRSLMFPLTGLGKYNMGNVFVELALNNISGSGRAGILNVSGLATDDSGKVFINKVLDDCRLRALYDFENRAGLFPGVHRSYKFSAITLSGNSLPDTPADFVFSAVSPLELKDPARHIELTDEDIKTVNPLSGTCPVFRSNRDASLVKKLCRTARLKESDKVCYHWEAEPSFMFVMSDHSHIFHSEDELNNAREGVRPDQRLLGEDYCLRLYESKLFHQFEHRWASFEGSSPTSIADSERVSPGHLVQPRYWMATSDADSKLDKIKSCWMIALREVTNATNERTAIASILPKAPLGHNAQFFHFHEEAKYAPAFVANLNSFAMDFVVRTKVGGSHLSSFIVRQLPILPRITFDEIIPWESETAWEWMLDRCVELMYTAIDLESFANDCNYVGSPFIWNEERRFEIRCELDAAFFHLYGIDDIADVDYIMETFPIVKRKDEAKYGSYRTKERILEIYQEMARCTAEGREYQSALNPPPGPPTDADGNFIPMSEWDPNHWPSHIHRPKEEAEG